MKNNSPTIIYNYQYQKDPPVKWYNNENAKYPTILSKGKYEILAQEAVTIKPKEPLNIYIQTGVSVLRDSYSFSLSQFLEEKQCGILNININEFVTSIFVEIKNNSDAPVDILAGNPLFYLTHNYNKNKPSLTTWLSDEVVTHSTIQSKGEYKILAHKAITIKPEELVNIVLKTEIKLGQSRAHGIKISQFLEENQCKGKMRPYLIKGELEGNDVIITFENTSDTPVTIPAGETIALLFTDCGV